jgi:signal transduction histidine kinase
LILVPTSNEGAFFVAGAAGQDEAEAAGQVVHLEPALRDLHAATASRALLTDGAELFRQLPGPNTGEILAIPLQAQNLKFGLLILREAKAPGFTQTDLQMGTHFGSHVALALELENTRVLHEEDLMYSDRDRIARDLHDIVIQRLFAAGLGIQTLPNISDHEEIVHRIGAITTELDESIKQLRETIYALHPTGRTVTCSAAEFSRRSEPA